MAQSTGRDKRTYNPLATMFGLADLPETEVDTLRWLVHLRIRIGIAMLLLLLAINLIGSLATETLVGLTILGLAYLLLGCLHGYLLAEPRVERFIKIVRYVQLPERLILCTLVVYISGGVLTPAFLVYPLVIIEAIILASPLGVYRTGAAATVLYCTLALLESYRLIPHFRSYFGELEPYNFATPSTYGLHVIIVATLIMLGAHIANRVAHLIRRRNNLIESRLKDLRTIYDVANGLDNITSEDEMLRYLATTLKETQGASLCLIGLMHDNQIEVKASAGISPDKLDKLSGIGPKTAGLEGLLVHGEPLVLEDINLAPELRKWAVSEDICSAYVYPIKSEGRVLGAMSLSFREHRASSPEYHHLLTTVASQTGVAIERARALSDAQRRAREMEALYDINLLVSSTLSFDQVIERIGGCIDDLISPDSYYIALYDADREMISFQFWTIMEPGQPRSTYPIKMEKPFTEGGLTAHIIESRQPVLIKDVFAEVDQYEAMLGSSGLKAIVTAGVRMQSILSVPMLWQGKVVGVVSAQCVEPGAFDARDQRLFEAMAAQMTMALENARLHQAAQEQARYDSLTQVYNHGHFIERVRQAVEASDRDDSEVALIMLDIDHFKRYNDTYGHVAGDNVLQMVASALKESVRDGDHVGRWGGEEFGVLLVGAKLTEAKQVSRRIRRAVSELSPVDGHGHVIPNPTVSQGISVYPFPSATTHELIENADAALYHAKNQGRNQLVVHNSGEMQEATITTGDLVRTRRPPTVSRKTRPLSLVEPAIVTTDHLGGKSSF